MIEGEEPSDPLHDSWWLTRARAVLDLLNGDPQPDVKVDVGRREVGGMNNVIAGCEKCGGFDSSVRWHETFYDCLYHQQRRDDWERNSGEHLHYQCRTCGWSWASGSP